MKLLTLAPALLLVALAAHAQTPAPATSPPPPAAPAPTMRTADDRPSSNDPRVCLEFTDNQQVIACAERFRPRRAAARS